MTHLVVPFVTNCAVAAIALCQVQAPQDQSPIAKFGLAETQPFHPTGDKVVLPNGAEVIFLGACDLKGRSRKPWGLDGRPVAKEREWLFWRAIAVKSGDKSAFADDPQGRAFGIAFAAHGTGDIDMPLSEMTSLRWASLHPSRAEGAIPALLGVVLKPPGSGDSFPFRLEFVEDKAVEVLRFEAGATNLPSGYEFQLQRKAENTMVEATRKSKTKIVFDVYLYAATLPESLRQMRLELVTSDWEVPRDPKDFPLAMSGFSMGSPGDMFGMKGKRLFSISVPRGKTPPTFVLRAHRTYIVEFPSIPRSYAR